MAFTCENHPDRSANWFRNTWIGDQEDIPICDECKFHYDDFDLSKHLKIRPIFGGTQGQGANHETSNHIQS